MSSNEMLGELVTEASILNEDELSILLHCAKKLAGEGRDEHGPLHLEKDRRHLRGECLDELVDAFTYLLMEVKRMEQRNRREYREDCERADEWVSKLIHDKVHSKIVTGQVSAQCAYCTADVPVCDCLTEGDQ